MILQRTLSRVARSVEQVPRFALFAECPQVGVRLWLLPPGRLFLFVVEKLSKVLYMAGTGEGGSVGGMGVRLGMGGWQEAPVGAAA